MRPPPVGVRAVLQAAWHMPRMQCPWDACVQRHTEHTALTDVAAAPQGRVHAML
jgi:hypothetical protein